MIIEFLIGFGLWATPEPSSTSPLQVEFTPPILSVEVYGPEGELRVLSGLPMAADTRAAYTSEFLPELTYFGAFAMGKDGSYGYVVGSNSLDAAREIAFEECEKHTSACLIYAEIVPVGYLETSASQATMSAEAVEYYVTSEERPSFRAMAISEDGSYSMVWGHSNQAAADRAALSDCEEYRIHDLPNLRDMSCVLVPLK